MPKKDPKDWTLSYQLIREWKLKNPDKVRRYRIRRNKRGSNRNGRKPWSDIEKAMLFDFDGTDTQLSKAIGRTQAAIQRMRSLLVTKQKAAEVQGQEDPKIPAQAKTYRQRPAVSRHNLHHKEIPSVKKTLADEEL